MEYQLIGLKENALFVTQPSASDDKSNFEINWSFSLDLNFPEPGQIEVSLAAKVKVVDPPEHPDIAAFSATHRFQVSDAKTFLFELSDSEWAGFLATLVGISLGTMRGLAYARTYNVIGPNIYMPVINPAELLEQSLPAIRTKLMKHSSAASEDKNPR